MSSSVPDPHAPDPDLTILRADPELARTFFSETFDHLSSIEASILALELRTDDPKTLNDVFRPFHSLKANAGALGIESVEELSHRVENLIDRERSREHVIGEADGVITVDAD